VDIRKFFTLVTSLELVQKMNNTLVSENFDIQQFNILIRSTRKQYNVKIKLFDFEYYDETRLEKAKQEKFICAQKHNFEKAASNRDLEIECQKYIDLKKQFKIEESMFFYEQDYLFYFYFGTAKNDKIVREILKADLL
jgi:hypothetical protein